MYDTGTDFYATDTYGTDTYATDPYGSGVEAGSWDEPATATCCCGDADSGTGYENSWELPPEPPAPTYEPAYEPTYEASAVMPAGQPGGPVIAEPIYEPNYAPSYEASAVMLAGQPEGPAVVEPASNPWEISSSDFVPVATSTVASNPWEISSSDFGGGDAASILSGSTTVIGPPPTGSVPDSLSQIYGLAGANGDIMTQIQVTRISDSIHRMNMAWVY